MTDAQQGLGRIFKRYRVFWIAYYHRGKERRESSHSRSRTDALRLLKRRLGEIGQGKLVGPQEERLTIDEILADLLTDYQVNGRASLPTLRAHLKALRVTFGGDKALSVRTSRIKAAQRAWQEAGVTNANINRRCTVLRRAFNLAKRAEKLSTVPYIPRLEEHAVPGKFITRDAFAAIHRHLPPLLQDFFELAYLTGVRRGQLARTTLANVNTERWALVWEPGQVKNRRAHVIPLDGRALEIVRRLWTSRRLDCPFLFHEDGKPLGDFRKRWATACKAAGFPLGRKQGGYIFHNTRHTACTNMVAAGVPESVAMSISGHRTRSVFDRYAIRREDVQRDAMARVSRYVADLADDPRIRPLREGAS